MAGEAPDIDERVGKTTKEAEEDRREFERRLLARLDEIVSLLRRIEENTDIAANR